MGLEGYFSLFITGCMEIQIQTDTDTLETDSGHSVMSSIHPSNFCLSGWFNFIILGPPAERLYTLKQVKPRNQVQMSLSHICNAISFFHCIISANSCDKIYIFIYIKLSFTLWFKFFPIESRFVLLFDNFFSKKLSISWEVSISIMNKFTITQAVI